MMFINFFLKFFGKSQSHFFFHETATVEKNCTIGVGTKIWHYAHVRSECQIGDNCVIGKSVFIDSKVKIGSNVKIQNFSTLYQGLTVQDGVYIGPSVTFTNDKFPRAINPNETLKSPKDWVLLETFIEKGASIGANSTILPGIKIGAWAMIGAGSVVTKDIPERAVVVGNPARIIGYTDEQGNIQSKLLRATA